MMMGIQNALELKYFTEFPAAVEAARDFHKGK